MNASYKTHMQAMNAARKEFGKDWKLAAKVEKNLIGEWEVNLIPTAELEPLHSAVAPLSASSPIPAPIPAPAGWELIDTSTEDQDEIDAVHAELSGAQDEPLQSALMAQQALADEAANAALLQDRNEEAVAKGIWVHKSSAEKPTKKVWHIADAMFDNAEHFARENDRPVVYPTRTEVQNECVRQGIASGTARTQYQHWWKARNDAKVAPIATIGKDGKITMPGK